MAERLQLAVSVASLTMTMLVLWQSANFIKYLPYVLKYFPGTVGAGFLVHSHIV